MPLYLSGFNDNPDVNLEGFNAAASAAVGQDRENIAPDLLLILIATIILQTIAYTYNFVYTPNASKSAFITLTTPAYIYALNIIITTAIYLFVHKIATDYGEVFHKTFLMAYMIFVPYYLALLIASADGYVKIYFELVSIETLSNLADAIYVLTALLALGFSRTRRHAFLLVFMAIQFFLTLLRFMEPVFSDLASVLSLMVLTYAFQPRLKTHLGKSSYALVFLLYLYAALQLLFKASLFNHLPLTLLMAFALAFKIILAMAYIAILLGLARSKIYKIQERLNATLVQCGIGNYVVDTAERIVSSNVFESTLVGVSATDLRGRFRKELYYTEADYGKLLSFIKTPLGSRNDSVVVRLRGADNNPIYVQEFSSDIFNEHAALEGREGIYFNVSAAYEYNQYISVAESSGKAFAATMSGASTSDAVLTRLIDTVIALPDLHVQQAAIALVTINGPNGSSRKIEIVRCTKNFLMRDFKYNLSVSDVNLDGLSISLCTRALPSASLAPICVPIHLYLGQVLGWLWLYCDNQEIEDRVIAQALSISTSVVTSTLRRITLDRLRDMANIYALLPMLYQPRLYLDKAVKEIAKVIGAGWYCACYIGPSGHKLCVANKDHDCRKDNCKAGQCRLLFSNSRSYISGAVGSEIVDASGAVKGYVVLEDRVAESGQRRVSWFTANDLEVLRFGCTVIGNALDYLEAESEIHAWIDDTAHEIMSPITYIVNTVDVVKRRNDRLGKQERDQYFRKIELSANTAIEAIGKLYDIRMRKSESQRIRREPELTMLYGEIILKCILEQQYIYEQDGINILFQVGDYSMLPPMYVFKTGMAQVFSNILNNAIKYRSKSATQCVIDIDFSHIKDYYIVSIRDSGIGVPLGSEDVIFERKCRAANAIEQLVEGEGIGLYICKEVMKRHNGDVVFVREDAFTRFDVMLPRNLVTRKGGAPMDGMNEGGVDYD